MRPLLTILLAVPLLGHAQDGGQLYAQYCSACHAEDGKGATGGLFPPLADSLWVAGEPDRAIQVVLHGLHGPVEVAGKTYNLVMPPQGAVLSDDHIAAILTYVRSSFGNSAGKVQPARVARARKQSAAREQPWTAEELLELHPLPEPVRRLKNLTSKVYTGEWKEFPDFSKLKAEGLEEENDGVISLENVNHEDHFAVVWEGEFIAPRSADITFGLDSDDESRLFINGKKVVAVDGTGPMGRERQGRVLVEKGPNEFRLEYREFEGGEGITLWWRGAGKPKETLSRREPQSKSGGSWPSIPIEASPERAAIYRNFIAGTTPRAIGIGLPGGLNLAYSGDHLAPELVWTGKFMDGGRHWTNRGQGDQPPAGDNVLKLGASPALGQPGRFRGYELDAAGNPTFLAEAGGLQIRDGFRASDRKMIRSIEARGDGGPLELLLAENLPVEELGDGAWRIAGVLRLEVEGGRPELADGKLRLPLADGTKASVTYDWTATP